MKTKAKQAVLKIMLLQEEFTEKEIKEAVNYINSNKKTSLNELFKEKTNNNATQPSSDSKEFEDQESRVVQDLVNVDPEKYKILSEVDSLIRKSAILRSNEDIKNLASKLSKNFPKTKSRKESIPKIMAILADLDISKIKTVVEEILKSNNSIGSDSEYQKLAQYLING